MGKDKCNIKEMKDKGLVKKRIFKSDFFMKSAVHIIEKLSTT
jgi:hypothetical protein